MALRFRYRLTSRARDALLSEQAALIAAQAAELERRAARMAALEAQLAQPKKTSQNSSIPPSQDQKPSCGAKTDAARKKSACGGHAGVTRTLTNDPNETIQRFAQRCPHCAVDVSGQKQRCRRCYDHMDIPPIRPHVTRIELYGGRCRACGKRFCAAPPDGMVPGTPFGVSIRALLLYLHHSHHVGFERLSRMMAELFGLNISQGAITNAFRRVATEMTAACAALREKLRAARVIASAETTTRIDGTTHWPWVFASAAVVLHQIAPRRAKAVAEEVLGDRRPQVWVSDRYAGQQDLAPAHQACLAHVLRDVRYAIDCGDRVFALRLRELLRWAIRIGRRRHVLRATTLRHYHARAEHRLDVLVAIPAAHPAGRERQDAVKAWRSKLFVFLEDPDVSATNNVCERELRPSVVFRKVTGGFRSGWGAHIHAGYRSVTGTARLQGCTALQAIGQLFTAEFEPAPAT